VYVFLLYGINCKFINLFSVCRPSLVLNFNSTPIRDISNMEVYVSNEGVDSVVSAGQFNKQGRIHIPMFSWIGHRMTITLRFFEWDGGDTEQTLMANCYHPIAGSNGRGSIEIMLRSETKEAIFRIKTTQSVLREIVIPYLVSLAYDVQILMFHKTCHIRLVIQGKYSGNAVLMIQL
jgi:hypothetical protein